MNKFDAEYKKQYDSNDGLITARQKIAKAINDNWYYSWHWKDETWVEQAKQDLIKRKQENAKECKQLNTAEFILNEIK